MEEHLGTRRATRRPEGATTLLAASEEPRIRTEVLHFRTGAGLEFWDVTEPARGVVERSGVRHGQVTVHTLHTTTSVVVNESETGFLNDFRRLIGEVAPRIGITSTTITNSAPRTSRRTNCSTGTPTAVS